MNSLIRLLRFNVVSSFIFFFNFNVFATHIVGGNISYELLNKDTFRINLYLYIDCINGSAGAISLDEIANISYFDAVTNQFIGNDPISVLRKTNVSKVNYQCLEIEPNACVQQFFFSYKKVINPGKNGVIVSFQRCCRNHSVSNILNPDATGATYFVKIPPISVVQLNTSPEFKKLPPNFICNNAPLVFDHSAVDKDGDSLSYSIMIPFNGGSSINNRPIPAVNPPYGKLIMKSPFNSNNMMNGSILLHIDPISGVLKVTPNETGQFVVAILVEEYRNGFKIGEVFRGYQLNVIDCQFSAVANFDFEPINCDRKVEFTNRSLGENIGYYWDFGVLNKTSDTSTLRNPTWNYESYGDYKVALIVNSDGCSDTIYETLIIRRPDTIASKYSLSSKLGCDSLTVKITNRTVADSFLWNFGDGVNHTKNKDFEKYFFTKEGKYIITLEIFDSNNCTVYSPLVDTINVLNRSYHNANFTISFVPNCESEGVVKILLDSISSTEYVWNFEKGVNFINETPDFYKYNSYGEHKITLTTNDTNFCAMNDTSTIGFFLNDFLSNMMDIQLFNIFTPDNDSFNNLYCIDADSFKCLELNYYIYNRYGNIVFEGKSVDDCWDGTNQSNGTLVPEGEYFGIFFFNNSSGNSIKMSNVITVRR